MTTHTPPAGDGRARDGSGVSDAQLVAAMRAFEQFSTVLRYREIEKWHANDIAGMRAALEVAQIPASADPFTSIAQWCEETFGPVTPERIASRAAEEMDELRADPSRVEEAADVVIVLSRYPGLWDAVQRKMRVNRGRSWKLMGDGTGYHVEADDTAARPAPSAPDPASVSDERARAAARLYDPGSAYWMPAVMDRMQAVLAADEAARPAAAALREENERLRKLLAISPDLAGLMARASQGKAYVSGSPWFTTGTLILVGSPDRHAGTIIADTDPMDMRDDLREDGREIADGDDDAALLAEAWNRLRKQAAALSPGRAAGQPTAGDGAALEAGGRGERAPADLRKEAADLEREAWRDIGGGQELTLQAMALEAEADRIEALATATPHGCGAGTGEDWG